ncbi:MAG: FAD-binding protein [Chloroflexi bacterium]|nr:FAD-binding protein [Chloroflexota bacterium]
MDEETGRVVGARLGGPRGPRTVRCGAVVLATGGFQGDVELLTRYVSPWADRLFLRASSTSTGDGLRMALAAGAAGSRGLQAFYGHLLPAPPARIDPATFRTVALYYSPESVALNLHGERFFDESMADELTTQALARQPEARGFLVFDEACYREHVLRPHLPDGPVHDPLVVIPAAGGVVLRADSLADLAAALSAHGVPPRVAQATLESYDAAIAAGAPERLTVPRRKRLHRLHRPPFYAIPVQPAITFTHGGVRVDTACRALDRDGRPVPGLYVAGVDAGGIFYEGYVGGLAASLVTGLRAGIHAARVA